MSFTDDDVVAAGRILGRKILVGVTEASRETWTSLPEQERRDFADAAQDVGRLMAASMAGRDVSAELRLAESSIADIAAAEALYAKRAFWRVVGEVASGLGETFAAFALGAASRL